jgi:MobA/MobL family
MGYHFNLKFVSRAKGQSLVAKGAYDARAKFREDRTGETKDYTYKSDRPVNAFVFAKPADLQDVEKLLNAIDRSETDPNAQTALSFTGAMPALLTAEERARAFRDFMREEFHRKNIPAVGHIHAPHEHAPSSRHANDNDEHHDEEPAAHNDNWHVHVKAGLRPLGPDGKFGDKYLTWGSYGEFLEHKRERWAEINARYLEKAGHKIEAERWRYGHLRQEVQYQKAVERGDMEWAEKKAKEASKHRGPKVDAMEKRGVETDRGNVYRDAKDTAAELTALKAELAELEKQYGIEHEAQREIQWQDAIARAAIEKEERGEKLGGAGHDTEPPAPAEPERGTLPAREMEKRADNPQRAAAQIWAAYASSPTPEAFGAKLEEKGMRLAAPTKEEAAAAPEYRAGEIVVVTGQGRTFKLDQRTTGDDARAVEKFLAPLDRATMKGVGATMKVLGDVANTLGGILTFLIPDPPKTRAEIKAMEQDAERAEAGERRAAYQRGHEDFVERREEERRRQNDRDR